MVSIWASSPQLFLYMYDFLVFVIFCGKSNKLLLLLCYPEHCQRHNQVEDI
jgi:hypothetical protein